MKFSYICVKCGCGIDDIKKSRYCDRPYCKEDDSDAWAMNAYKKENYNRFVEAVKELSIEDRIVSESNGYKFDNGVVYFHQKGKFKFPEYPKAIFLNLEDFVNDVLNANELPEYIIKKLDKAKDYKICFGKYKNRMLSSMVSEEEISYLKWFVSTKDKENEKNETYFKFKKHIKLTSK